MTQYFYCCLLSCLLALPALAQVAPEPQTIVPGQPVEREIAGNESHTYQIPLMAGQFVRFRLEQRAIGAALILTAPEGKQLLEMDLTLAGQPESLSLEAAVTGSYWLTVRGHGQATAHGSYRLETAVQAEATAASRQCLAAETLLVEANKLWRKDQQAIEKLQQALPLWRELREPFWVAWSLENIGYAYNNLRQSEKAIEYFEQARARYRELKNQRGEGEILTSLGISYLKLNQYEKAAEYHEQALAFVRTAMNRHWEGEVLMSFGSAYYYHTSTNEKAIDYYEQARVLYRELNDQSSEAGALRELGRVYHRLGQSEKAMEYFEQTRVLYRELRDLVWENAMLHDLAAVCHELGWFDRAIDYFEQALVLCRERKYRSGEYISLYNLGYAYSHTLGQPEKAIEYLEQARALQHEVKGTEVNALHLLGLANAKLGRYEQAIGYFEQVRAINGEKAEVYRDWGNDGNTLNDLGLAYAKLGRDAQAMVCFEDALNTYREAMTPGNGSLLARMGQVQRRLGRLDEAATSFTQAVTFLKARGNKFEESTALGDLARTEHDRGHLLEALTHLEESLRLAESLRANLISPDSRAAFLVSIQDSYLLYIDLLMRLHRHEPRQGMNARAVEVNERRRARSLLDLLTEARAEVRQGVDTALLERERILGRQINDRTQRLTQAATPEQAAALKQEIGQLETRYERAQTAIRKASPHYAALMQPQPLKLPEIQQQLDADTLLLEYALGEERSYLWAITNDSLTSYELPKGEEIKQRALQVYELLTARSTPNPDETPTARRTRLVQAEANLPAAAQALSRMILGPVAAQLGNKRLVIVADGALQYVPFAMLPEPVVSSRLSSKVTPNRPLTTDHRPPLIVNHEIINLPSASALAIQRAELAGRKPAPKALAVLADPVFDRTDPRLKASAKPAEASLIAANLDARGFGLNAKLAQTIKQTSQQTGTENAALRLQRLPGTRQEAERILALAPLALRRQSLDFAASRATATDPALGQYRIVHFATHGFLNSLQPELSGIVLSLVDEQGRAQEGFLLAHEIYNLKLPAELVVLSACETGLGKDVKGEGLVGLTRGFMYAGAARIVVSLWSVNDRATADLMTRFYQKMLQQGARPAAALRAAQIEMWQQKQWQSPFYWAPFVMQGEWR